MLLAIAVSMFMLLGFLPGVAVVDPPEPAPNFGFVRNSWDASVSKVDLVNFEEVARYCTAVIS